jgi:hypothetical protein
MAVAIGPGLIAAQPPGYRLEYRLLGRPYYGAASGAGTDSTPADVLYQRVQAVWSSAHAPNVDLHDLTCAPGTAGDCAHARLDLRGQLAKRLDIVTVHSSSAMISRGSCSAASSATSATARRFQPPRF